MSSILEKKLKTQEIAKDFLIPFSVQGVILGVAGCVLTVPVICILLKSNLRKLHSDLVMIGILCFNNLIISISLFFTSIFILCGYNAIVYNDYLCDTQLIVFTNPLLINSYIVGLISFERCLLIVYNIKLSNSIYIIITLILFAIPTGVAIRNLTVAHYLVSVSGVYPTTSPEMTTKFPVLAVLLCLGLISMVVVIASYINILIFRISHLNQNRQNLNISKEEIFQEKLRIVLKSLLILFVFIFNHSGKLWMFYSDVVLKTPRAFLVDAITQNLIIYSSITDVTLLLVMNVEIRKKFWNFFKLRSNE
ncbi:hypothetical protein CONCODRAFT_8966 [Conidiobolus coronatus NRRL 28638]|uniref:G-protein coupled receptors family 1 profile domain-containing protein n=1 Tax=Conidiobolus coronatus (strain ATCC 28846 / CBS 209.66 / NRRL 28638) TaxID=796925 RepID=A0A137P0V9_CONC2|nr:hypothetical protein CONCODRAFT_8966 [Conidiobolus coronatus NRRL 28638]|eukprot:KXN68710.1 hypothetical protein CONCODRAFT_8966 [Conidiobolus coronatus NRRL 28638]